MLSTPMKDKKVKYVLKDEGASLIEVEQALLTSKATEATSEDGSYPLGPITF